MGMKKDAYDRAQLELIEKGYLTTTGGNKYSFRERPAEDETHHPAEVIPSAAQQELPTRNITRVQEDITNTVLPVISMRKVTALGIEGYAIEADIITFSTGKKYRLIE